MFLSHEVPPNATRYLTTHPRDVACVVKFFSMKMKHVPEASDIPSFADAVGTGSSGVQHHLDVVAQASGFSEKEAQDLDAFVATEGWGGDDNSDADEEEKNVGDDDVNDAVEEQQEDGDEEQGSDSGEEGEEEGEAAEEGRIRRVKAPESLTKRAHAAVQRQRKVAGAMGAAKPSRNHQKRKEKGKMLYKHRDF